MSRDIAIAAPDGATAHYLVEDAESARRALEEAGIEVLGVSELVLVPLRADVPGELGRLMQRLADANVGLTVQYTDHENRQVFVVDDRDAAAAALA